MTLTPKDWMEFIKSVFATSIVLGTVGVWAGDLYFATDDDLHRVSVEITQKINQGEINQLDREITFLAIKITQKEATTAEHIYIETLKLQLRAMKNLPPTPHMQTQ